MVSVGLIPVPAHVQPYKTHTPRSYRLIEIQPVLFLAIRLTIQLWAIIMNWLDKVHFVPTCHITTHGHLGRHSGTYPWNASTYSSPKQDVNILYSQFTRVLPVERRHTAIRGTRTLTRGIADFPFFPTCAKWTMGAGATVVKLCARLNGISLESFVPDGWKIKIRT